MLFSFINIVATFVHEKYFYILFKNYIFFIILLYIKNFVVKIHFELLIFPCLRRERHVLLNAHSKCYTDNRTDRTNIIFREFPR